MADTFSTLDTGEYTPLPKVPKAGELTMQDVLGVREPFTPKKRVLQEKLSGADLLVEQAKQQKELVSAKGEVAATKKQAEDIRGAEDTYQSQLEAEPLPAFVPDKESAKDIAGLFSMVSVMGLLLGGGGKLNAMQALSAMNGMLEGHQKGRADLYKKQATEFDKNFKSMIKKHEEFRKKMEDAVKLAAVDKEAGLADAKMAAVEAGSPIIKAMVDRGEIIRALETLNDTVQGREAALKLVLTEQDRAATRKAAADRELAAERRHREDREAAERRHTADMAQRKELAQLRSEGKVTKGSQSQQQFENITSADIGNAYFRINEYLADSKDGKIPEGSKFLRDKGTQSGIIDAYKNYLINATLPANLQKNDATLLGIAFDVVAARAFGRASGVTDSKIAQVVRQLPVEGDNESTKQAKMRILLNQLEEPNKLLPEEKRKDGATYMKSPVARGLYRTYSEKLDTGEMKETEGLEDTESDEPSYMNQSEIDTERKNAKAALSAGAPENLVKERFKKTTGQEL
jgi:hypothetical protein